MADENKQSSTDPKPVYIGEKTQKGGLVVRVVIITLSAILIVVGIIGLLAVLWR